ncbi:acyl-CoA thioesterase [Mycobacterium florentinum]|uniref:acyl-CoA thioesterase n=1 Tax=Mycobacterium florentinum TaxID=292462 RepID=UPI0013D8CCB2|nr:acyl-CoA thioesterase domain-containing protein [Mycobacterium florentinum]MCV7412590.1 thioesterase family protein [Mycobacterium florentinum]
MTADIDESVPWWRTVFALHEIAPDTYRAAPVHSGLPRLYGGQVGAQSLLAAAATVDSTRPAHSLQTSFLHAGDDTRPVTYDVERVRDSRSMSTRVVTARQDGRMLATTVASFHTPARCDSPAPIEHEWPRGDTTNPLPGPDTLPSRRASLSARYGAEVPAHAGPRWPVDLRYVDHIPWSDSTAPPRNRIWLTAIGYPREISGADAAAVAFATDLPMFEPVYFPTGMAWHDMVGHTTLLGATLNHSVWFHRPARLDDWLLLEQFAPIAHEYRAFCRGELRSRSRQLVASVAQEMVFVAPRKPDVHAQTPR